MAEFFITMARNGNQHCRHGLMPQANRGNVFSLHSIPYSFDG